LDFRPISLIHSFTKIITKVLANAPSTSHEQSNLQEPERLHQKKKQP
jgi:hypothetical protein